MKTVVFTILAVCFAALLAAQASSSGKSEGWMWVQHDKGSAVLQIKAKHCDNAGPLLVRLTGVEIKTDAISLEADEADFNPVSR